MRFHAIDSYNAVLTSQYYPQRTSLIPLSKNIVRTTISLIGSPFHVLIATWGLYYSARDTYGPLVGLPADSELTPAFWHKLTEVFTTNDTAFQMFNTFLSRGGAVTPCDATDNCQNTTICDMRALRSQNNCVCVFLTKIQRSRTQSCPGP